MNKIERWENECLKKKRYDSYFAAERSAKKRGPEAGVELHTYRCSSCGYWHLTKQSQSPNRYKFLKVV